MKLHKFQHQQLAFTAHIRDPQNQTMPAGIEPRRMKVYAELLYNNIEGFISSGFPVIRSIYSDADWHTLIRDFFANYRCRTPYFLEISREFIDYLQWREEQSPGSFPASLLELAHYEWVELALSVAEENIDMHGIDANGDLLNGCPVLSPLAWPLAYRYPVHKLGPNYLPQDAQVQNSYLVVYRNRQDQVEFLQVNSVTARLISLLQADATLRGEQLIDSVIDELQHPNEAVVREGGLQALQQLQAYGILLGTRLP